MKKKEMPAKRDVSAQKGGHDPDPNAVSSSKAEPSLVTVMGFDKNDILFKSSQVGTVQWRDSDGLIVALLVRLRPDVWGFSRRGDDDWEEVLGIYGNPDCP